MTIKHCNFLRFVIFVNNVIARCLLEKGRI